MIERVPVRVRRSENGNHWYASGLTYSALGRGKTPDEALTDLKKALEAAYPNTTVELRIRSLSVTFPASLSEDEFLDLDVVKARTELAG